jgi:hypothetical protein
MPRSLNTGAMPEKTSGVWGLAPKDAAEVASKTSRFLIGLLPFPKTVALLPNLFGGEGLGA